MSVALLRRLRGALTDDLRRPRWRGHAHPMAGHCYVASEALYHMLGGKASGWKPASVRHEDSVHWFLRRDGHVLDLTGDQFEAPPPYAAARGRGFLTRSPSKRAAELIRRMEELK